MIDILYYVFPAIILTSVFWHFRFTKSYDTGFEDGKISQIIIENKRWEENMRNPDWKGI